MRQYPGTDKRDPDAIQRIDYFLQDLQAAMARIELGQVPSGGGGTIAGVSDHGLLEAVSLTHDDHAQYLLLAGRTGGQTILSTAVTDAVLTVTGLTSQTGALLALNLPSGAANTSFLKCLDSDGVVSVGICDAAGATLGYPFNCIYGKGVSGTAQGLQLWSHLAASDQTASSKIIMSPGGALADVDVYTGDFNVFNGTNGSTALLNVNFAGSTTIHGITTIHQGPSVGALLTVDNETTMPVGSHMVILRRGGSGGSKQSTNLLQFRSGSSETSPLDNALLSYFDTDGVFYGTVNGTFIGTLPDHLHAAVAGDGGNLPLYLHLAGTETITGQKTFPDNCLLLVGSADATKEMALDVDTEVPTGTRVTLVVPDSGGIIATEPYVNLAISQSTYLATGSVITQGTETSGTYDTTNAHDGVPWLLTETASGIDVQLTFSSIVAVPTELLIRAYYAGGASHTVDMQAWDYVGGAWASYHTLTNDTVYGFHTITLTTPARHTSGGEAKVRFLHSSPNVPTHILRVDYCALIKSGFGAGIPDHGTLSGLADDDHPQYVKDSEFTADSDVLVGTGSGTFAAESGATLRTSLGLGTGDSPQFTAVNIGAATDTTITRTAAGNIAVEGGHIVHVVGVGYESFGTDWDAVTTPADEILLASGHLAGKYRLSFTVDCTTAGGGGSTIKLGATFHDGVASRAYTMGGWNTAGAVLTSGAMDLTNATTGHYNGSLTFRSNGSADIVLDIVSLTFNTTIVMSIYTVLEYLGA